MILFDTSVLVAAADTDDKHHASCVDLVRRTRPPLYVPAPVLVETCYLLEREQGTSAEGAFLRSIRDGQVQLIDLIDEDIGRMIELIETYADLPLGSVDAAIVAVAERVKATEIATLNHRDFSVVRPRSRKYFTLLPS